MYKIKEIYYTIQGEGYHTGRSAVFCRFSGCNLWTGREQDRDKAICKFCDTDFWGTDGLNGGKYTAIGLTQKIKEIYTSSTNAAAIEVPIFVVCTGGEPALQMDDELVTTFHQHGIIIAIETNGTVTLPTGIDWICVSPKADTDIIVTTGHELKLVYPQLENQPSQYEQLAFDHFYLQPLDDANQEANTKKTIAYCMQNPRWNLSMQTHKYLGID